VKETAGSTGLAQWTGVLTGPLVALIGQQILYAVNERECTYAGSHVPLHVIAILLILVVLASAELARRVWRSAARESIPRQGTPEARANFLGILGIGSALFSVLVIITMWLPFFYYGPCHRA
jgi:hypothetical protein